MPMDRSRNPGDSSSPSDGLCRVLYLYAKRPYHSKSALWPVADQLERAAGFRPHEPPEAKLNKLEAVLGQVVSDPGDASWARC